MGYRFEFRPYRRSFRQPLRTHHGLWATREGIVVRVSQVAAQLTGQVAGQVAWGEIAPLPDFGSETWTQALSYCVHLAQQPWVEWPEIPSHLPACQFGLESAREMLAQLNSPLDDDLLSPLSRQPISYLLPTGIAALEAWRSPYSSGTRTFKWKIGVRELAEEIDAVQQLLEALPSDSQLRLDANGGLSLNRAEQWLTTCDRLSQAASGGQIEFLEQPLPIDQFDAMLDLSRRYSTPLALDESVTTVAQMEHCYQQGWRGIVVIKAAIAGSPGRLRRFCQRPGVDMVWSSVFETAIAQQFILTRLIPSVPPTQRALGFGVNHWFSDRLNDRLNHPPDYEFLWQSLSPFCSTDGTTTG